MNMTYYVKLRQTRETCDTVRTNLQPSEYRQRRFTIHVTCHEPFLSLQRILQHRIATVIRIPEVVGLTAPEALRFVL